MAEELTVNPSLDKKEQYQSLIPQLEALVEDEADMIANMANIAAALSQTFGFFWVGFYIVREQLVLGPFQGPIACSRINLGKGVCGRAWEQKKTIVVPDVDLFPGHIACNGASRSEIVVPGMDEEGNVRFVLDVDSSELSDFNEIDQYYLEKIVALI